MRVYVSIDLEGTAGVVHVDQTRRGGHDYEMARRWMTAEANAAVAGALDGGASEVLVNDAHGDMRNLVLSELDPRAEVISGALKPGAMVAGASSAHAVALFVGYHAGASTHRGVLDHTYFGRAVTACRVGGEDFDEAALNAAALGDLGVPVGLVTGDGTVCAAARRRFGDVETVAVKEALGRYAARSIHPDRAAAEIRAAAARATRRAGEGAFSPFRPAPPLAVELDLVNAGCADAAELVPGTQRRGGVTLRYEAPDAATALQLVRAWTKLAGTEL